MARARGGLAILTAALLGVCGRRAASGQALAPSATDRATAAAARDAFGTSSLSVLTLGAWSLVPRSPTATWHFVSGTNLRYFDAPGAELEGGVLLPSGVSIERIELEGCDGSTAGESAAALISWAAPGGPGAILGLIETGIAEMPGCGFFSLTLQTPVTVDNENFQYQIAANSTTFDGATAIAAVRLYYRLQVSPAPASPTFFDVPPDDLGFRYVEALAASGITGGCGGGNFCPDALVTRRQMAIFLAKALGLHWSN